MYSITKNGKCAKHLCVIDEKSKSVSTTENGLVFDFSEEHGWSFKAGFSCTFITCWGCTFKTGSGCTFKTGHTCTFNTGHTCTFDTGSGCTFNTSYGCTFDTSYGCTFKVGEQCVLVRRDVFETFVLPVNKTVVLNEREVQGYTIKEEKKKVTLELTDEQIEMLKQQGVDI